MVEEKEEEGEKIEDSDSDNGQLFLIVTFLYLFTNTLYCMVFFFGKWYSRE